MTISKKKTYEIKTKAGIPLDISVSWLQKSIRRGQEQTALWIAEDLFVSGFQRYLLYRLWICSHEDIGPANLPLVQLVTSTYQTWLLHKKEKKDFAHSGENRVLNGNLVVAMARSQKCRLADDATQFIFHKKQEGWIPEMNSLAVVDAHTKSGKQFNYTYRHWLEIGSKCANLNEGSNEVGKTYKAECEQIWLELADQNNEPQLPTDPEIEELGLK